MKSFHCIGSSGSRVGPMAVHSDVQSFTSSFLPSIHCKATTRTTTRTLDHAIPIRSGRSKLVFFVLMSSVKISIDSIVSLKTSYL